MEPGIPVISPAHCAPTTDNRVKTTLFYRASFVDSGGTLIPWMGDPNQPIDRYDGRATIYNLEPFEAPKDAANKLEPKDYLTLDEVRTQLF